MPVSYVGKVLHVDLTSGDLRFEEPPDSFYRLYGGGSAMGLYYVLKNMPPGIDPLAPESVLTFFTGVPTGLPLSGLTRMTANAKSPMTGAIGDSECGGFFPAYLKFAGVDGIVIKGRSPTPVYLWISEGKAELRDAGHIWGMITGDAEDTLRQELGDRRLEVLQVGPAGEQLVRFANIINMCCRANGRTGMGAVMGSKQLKAVVVRRGRRVQPADPEGISRLAEIGKQNFKDNPELQALSESGTGGFLSAFNMMGSLPTRNYNEGQFEHFDKIDGVDTILKRRSSCYGCILSCKRVVETEYDGRRVIPRYGGPEYETLCTFGSYCGVHELRAVALLNQICNQYGIDTISCGATVAFAMECFENGLIGPGDIDGVELAFGNADAVVRIVDMICKREGFGDVLAEGSRRAAQRIGGNAEDYLVEVKGSEVPAHIPHAKRTLGLIYAVNPFGPDHQSSEHDPGYEEGINGMLLERISMLGLDNPQPAGSMNEEMIRFAYLTQLFYSAADTYDLCQFIWGPSWQLYGPDDTVEMLRAATGWDITLEEVMRVGERRLNMMRAFNAREGFDRHTDTLPKKFFVPLQGEGPTAGTALSRGDIEQQKDIYYEMAGWEVEKGIPTQEKLDSLELGWIDWS